MSENSEDHVFMFYSITKPKRPNQKKASLLSQYPSVFCQLLIGNNCSSNEKKQCAVTMKPVNVVIEINKCSNNSENILILHENVVLKR